ncbi:cellulose biosynthesis protein BcsC [Brevundimonas naejangsanensis]|uniref:cellulose biosynthesis protein BcsC n=1 Tax=Brevundimonas naejangsanensis TaxID=588932 RepID=UPI0026EFC03C|nr:cellulose biosynthesis protein BcsC [Brevundimonas naejangsanensis]
MTTTRSDLLLTLSLAALMGGAALAAPSGAAAQSQAGVSELLRQGDYWAQRGRRDLADQAYRRVLQIDPGNAAAQRGLRGGTSGTPAQPAPTPPRPSTQSPAASPAPTPPRTPAVAAPRAPTPARPVPADRGAAQRAAGFQALERGVLDQAARSFEAALALRPGDRDAAGGLGVVRLRQGRFAEARDLLERASAGGGDARWREALASARFYAELEAAETAADAGDVETARTRLEALVRTASGNERSQAEARLAGLLADQGRYEEAAAQFEAAAATASDPQAAAENRRRALQASASAAVRAGDASRAETLYQSAFQAGGGRDVWLRYAFADFLLDQGRNSDAAAIALPLESLGPEGLYAAGLLYEKGGRSADAARVLRLLPPEARNREVQALEGLIQLGEVEARARRLIDQGRLAEAQAALDAAPRQGLDGGGLARLGDAYLAAGAEAQAGALAREAAQRAGGAAATEALVALLARTGQDDAALALIGRTSGGARSSEAARLYAVLAINSADRLREQGRRAEAFEVLRAGWDLAPDDADILTALGRLYQSGGLDQEAARVFEMALVRRPDDIDALGGLAAAAAADGDYAAARRAAARRVQLRPRDPGALQAAAQVEQAAGDRAAARRLLEQAAALEVAAGRLAPGQAFSALNPFRDEPSAFAGAPNPFAPETLGRGSAGGRSVGQAERASGPPAGSARAALDALARQDAPQAEAQTHFRGRSGEEGLSALHVLSGRGAAGIPIGPGRLSAVVEGVVVDAGTPSRSGSARFGTNATAEALAIVAQQPAVLAAPGAQYDAGASVGVAYETETVRADIATTPLGFRFGDVQGGLSWRPRLGRNGALNLFLERRPVTESLLSWAGAVDPATGQAWGGVMRTGGGLGFSWERDGTGGYAEAAYRAYRGRRVADNSAVEVNLGAYRRFYDANGLRLGAGAAANYQAFERNLGYFTLGHGGYFSPQSFASLSFPLTADWASGPWSLSARAAPGFQTYQQDEAPLYPTLPVEQAVLEALKAQDDDVRAHYDSASRSGFAFSGRLEAWYALSPATAVGAEATMTTFGDYDDYAMMLRLKQAFGYRP